MKYKNIKTQAVIETACVVSGENWVKVKETKKSKKSKKQKAVDDGK